MMLSFRGTGSAGIRRGDPCGHIVSRALHVPARKKRKTSRVPGCELSRQLSVPAGAGSGLSMTEASGGPARACRGWGWHWVREQLLVSGHCTRRRRVAIGLESTLGTRNAECQAAL